MVETSPLSNDLNEKKSEEKSDASGEKSDRIENAVAKAEHPLHSKFTFYFIRRTSSVRSQESYESSIQTLGSFTTVEGFWGVYNHLVRPGSLSSPADYHLFRDNIKPIWEHDENRKGGKWLIRLKKGLASRFWEEMVMALVGEQFDSSDEICGIVVSIRYQEDILAIWNRTSVDHASTNRIRENVKRLLQLPPTTVMEYKAHDTAIRDKSSFRNTDVFRPPQSRRTPVKIDW